MAEWNGFRNRTLRVTTAEYEPFVWWETDGDGNTVYRGLVVSLLEAVAQQLNFRISWQLSSDGQFGSTNSTGHWTGVVGDLLYGRADIAATGLTINAAREEVIDFSVPYWEESLGVLVRSNQQSKLLAPVRPFSGTLWLCILVAFLVVSFAMSALAWLRVRYGLSKAGGTAASWWREDRRSGLYLSNFACCMKAFLCQGNTTPITCQSRRYVFGTWLLTCIVLYASYTASLTSELTVSEQRAPFQTLQEMLEQNTYKFGTWEGDVALLLMKDAAKGSIYQRMYEKVQTVPVDVPGCDRVPHENFAWITDQTFLLVCASDNCDTMLIDERFFKSGFGLAFPENWPYKKHFDSVVQRLIQGGMIDYWKKQWFPRLQCQRGAYAEARSISLGDTVGVFLLLAMGISLALCVICIEHLYSIFMKNIKIPK